MLSLRLALRELRGGMRGLRLLAICLFLGVAALASVGSLSAAIVTGLAEQGQVLLGGDVELSVAQRPASTAELSRFRREGEVSGVTRMRAMASRPDGAESLLVELKAVDDLYPLYGRLRMAAGASAPRPDGAEAAIGADLADRLRLGVGDRIRVGEAQLSIVGLIAEEPDRAGQGFTLGSTVLVDPEGLAATRLVRPGSLYSSNYRLRLPAGINAEAVAERLSDDLRDAGYEVRDRTNGAPGTRRFIERVGQFLTLVGLTALVIAGIGVGNGVASYVDARAESIAALKMLGATSRIIFRSYLAQVGLVAAGATAAGLVAGAVAPWIVTRVAGDSLPVPPRLDFYPLPLAASAAYGLLIAFVFASLPLARAGAVPAAALFRSSVETLRRPGWRAIAAAAIAAGAVATLAIAGAGDPGFAALFIGAALGFLLLLGLVGWLIRHIAARLPRPRRPVLRLALANLHRPHAQTGRLVTALGLGLTLFAALAVVETSLNRQLETTIPDRAPSFFLLDIPVAEIDRFRTMVTAAAPSGDLVTVPSLRGTVVSVAGQRVSEMSELPDGAWFLRGDRGLTYAAELPEGSRIVEGEWWPAGYRGPPLVSIDVDAARAVGLEVGDAIVVSVLGREIEARIASLREINWDTLGFNFVIVFAPGALEAAPHSFMATVSMPEASERGFARQVAANFPTVSAIRVKDAVETAATMLRQLMVAVRAAASVAILAGIAVLAGALAAQRRERTYDSVMLKLLGATRPQILASQAAEFAALALIVALLAFALGTAAGWYVVVRMFELEFTPDWGIVAATLSGGALLMLILGLAGALPALAARPARALRAL